MATELKLSRENMHLVMHRMQQFFNRQKIISIRRKSVLPVYDRRDKINLYPIVIESYLPHTVTGDLSLRKIDSFSFELGDEWEYSAEFEPGDRFVITPEKIEVRMKGTSVLGRGRQLTFTKGTEIDLFNTVEEKKWNAMNLEILHDQYMHEIFCDEVHNYTEDDDERYLHIPFF